MQDGRPFAALRGARPASSSASLQRCEVTRHVVEQAPVVRAEPAEVADVDVDGAGPRAARRGQQHDRVAHVPGSGACICSLVASVSVSVTA